MGVTGTIREQRAPHENAPGFMSLAEIGKSQPTAVQPPEQLARLPVLRVGVVTMEWPTTEAFAVVELRSIASQGVQVSVYALRPFRKRKQALVSDPLVHSIPSSSARLGDGLTAFHMSLRHPMETSGLVKRAFAWGVRRKRHLLRGTLLVPRCLAIARSLEKWRPDVVHLFWGHYPALLGWIVKRLMPGTALTMFLGAYDLREGYLGSSVVGAEADAIVTHSRANLRLLGEVGLDRSRVAVIHRGIDLSCLKAPSPAKVPGRVVVVARLVRHKRVNDALAAFGAAARFHPQATLVVVGDGPERTRLSAQVDQLGLRSKVQFVGQIPQESVFHQLALAEVFVLLSEYEAIPNAAKEAMARGCAVIVSETPGIRELVVPWVNGIVVGIGDTENAAAALRLLLSAPALRERFAAAGATHLKANFDAMTCTRHLVDIWTLAAKRQRHRNICGQQSA